MINVWKRGASLLLAVAMLAALAVTPALAAEEQAPPTTFTCSSNFGWGFTLEFTYVAADWAGKISGVAVNGTAYERAGSSFGVGNNMMYYVRPNDGYLYLGEGFEGDTATCVISAAGYQDLTLALDKTHHTAEVVENTGGAEGGDEGDTEPVPPAEDRVIDLASVCFAASSFGSTWELTVPTDEAYVPAITGVTVNGVAWSQTTYLAAGQQYKISDTTLLFAEASFDAARPALKSGDVIVITAEGYQDLTCKLVIDEKGQASLVENDDMGDPYQIHVKLVGSFEAAITGQTGYDAVSGASTGGASSSKNSAVTVYGALVEQGQTPADSDWEELDHQSAIQLEGSKCAVSIVPDESKGTAETANSGMVGVYATYSSALELRGTPIDAGHYLISVSITDDQGRTATSNQLPFRVYTGQETLADQLRVENLKQYASGKYAWDIMEPWAIENFGSNVDGEDNSVRVPADLEVWFGSHISGTYGYLGYDLPWETVRKDEIPQTLYIPTGCDLTLTNLHVLSSVRVVVEEGGKLTLSDSVVQGIVEVEKGGTFSMNYDSYGGAFTTGASLCGQLRLADGAILENAAIYSHTNYLANGDLTDRSNQEAVVMATGTVTVRGQVFIAGDDAGGTDQGQTGLLVRDGRLCLADEAVLVVYGGSGGDTLLYPDGGTAIELDNGTITGSGKVVAIGGTVLFGNGGHGVAGTGSITAGEAFLQGATSYKDAAPGRAVDGAVKVTSPSRHQANGQQLPMASDDPLADLYWKTAIAPVPPLDRFVTTSVGTGSSGGSHGSRPGGSNSGNSNGGSGNDSAGEGAADENVPSHAFTDVPADAYCAGAVQWAAGKGITTGLTSTTFGMDVSCTRGQIVTFLWRAAGSPAPQGTADLPADVDADSYCAAAVAWALEQGIAKGLSDDTFGAEQTCTRGQSVTFLFRAMGTAVDGSPTFTDVLPDAFYASAVAWAVEQGITTGTSATTFDPANTCTRGQIVTFLCRAFQGV